jgi:hypothetical protein
MAVSQTEDLQLSGAARVASVAPGDPGHRRSLERGLIAESKVRTETPRVRATSPFG